jgi:outer membrane protein assembly factor BamB
MKGHSDVRGRAHQLCVERWRRTALQAAQSRSNPSRPDGAPGSRRNLLAQGWVLPILPFGVKKSDLLGSQWPVSGKVMTWLPVAAAIAAALLLGWWITRTANVPLSVRVPGTDQAAGADGVGGTNAVLLGKLIKGDGMPSALPGSWTGFRGANRDGLSRDSVPLARGWESAGPRELWAVDVGEGYAGAAVANGRVYVMDYDREKKQDALRCLSLDDGREIWRYSYPVPVKRNHGMSRTVPALLDGAVVAMGPKCHVVCLDANSGALRWGLDLVRQFGATVPPWYAGQCPLLVPGQAILAPGGKNALLIAVDLVTGKVLWQTPNPKSWKMTHSSIVPMEFGGQRIYVYCANLGVVGVSARDGSLLWDTTDWKISFATVPSPVPLDGGRVFLSGGYNAGSLLLQLMEQNGRLSAKTAYKLEPEVFGATQHTPILDQGDLYGVRPDGQFVCLGLDGKVKWSSGAGQTFGLGSFILGDGLFFVLNDSGKLSLIEASSSQYRLLAQAQVLKGHESWGPMALAGGRLLARDLTKLVCLDVAKH